MRFSFFANKYDSEPQEGEVSFEELADTLQSVADADKETAPLWSPAVMVGGKTEDHTESVEALSLDFDGVEPPWEALAAWNYVAHTTHSHKTVCDKNPDGSLSFWRVVVELAEAVPAAEWKRRFKVKCAMHGFPCDPKCCNPNRSFFVPPPTAEWRTNFGEFAASMPALGSGEAELEREVQDLDDNADGLLSDGEAFWPAVDRMMRQLPKSVSGQGGDDRLYEAACILRKSFRLTRDAAFKALQIFNERCEPPWDESRLWYKIEQAAKDTQHVSGELVPPELKEAAARERAHLAGEPEPEATGYIDLAAFALEIPRVEWVNKRLALAPGRPNMLYAHAHTGKSLATAALGLAAATGTKAFGDLDLGPARQVIYLENEDVFDVQLSVNRLCRGLGLQLPAGQFVVVPRKVYLGADPDAYAAGLQILEWAFQNAGLVIINSLRSLTPGTEENSSQFAAPLNEIAHMSERYNVAALVNHHTNKTGGVRGTTAIEAAEGNAWTIVNEEGKRIWSHTGVRMCQQQEPFELALIRRAAPPLYLEDSDTDGIKLERRKVEDKDTREELKVQRENARLVEQAKDKILSALNTANRWFARSELVQDLGVKNDAATEALRQLRTAIPAVVGYKKDGRSDFYHREPKMTPKA